MWYLRETADICYEQNKKIRKRTIKGGKWVYVTLQTADKQPAASSLHMNIRTTEIPYVALATVFKIVHNYGAIQACQSMKTRRFPLDQ